MAIGHFNVAIVGRSSGQSSVHAAAYAARERLTDERTGIVYDYARKSADVTVSFLWLPKDAPETLRDRAALWNGIERKDNRINSQLARRVILALPHELTAAQQEQLLKDYVREQFTRKGLACDASIHKPHEQGDQRNDHAHLLIPTRFIDKNGIGAKDRDSNSTENLLAWRDAWEKLANRHLERHGHDVRISMKSLEEQGIDREPQMHMGQAATALERKGIETDRGDQQRQIANDNRERANDNNPQLSRPALEQERRRQFLAQQGLAWEAIERQGLELASRHAAALNDFRAQHREDEQRIKDALTPDPQPAVRSGFSFLFSFFTKTLNIGRNKVSGPKIEREKLERQKKMQDNQRELLAKQAEERQRWEEKKSALLEQQAFARDLFERQLRESSPLQQAFEGSHEGRDTPRSSQSSEFSRMAARREAQRARERDGPGLER